MSPRAEAGAGVVAASQPASRQVWWGEPLQAAERLWIAVALAWCLGLFAVQPVWRVNASPAAPGPRLDVEVFLASARAMVARHTVRTDAASGTPVVRPPAGSDVYLVARQWSWWPMLELEQARRYRLHVAALDYAHGFAIAPLNLDVLALPAREQVVEFTPARAGTFTVACAELCGAGHAGMLMTLVVAPPAASR